MTDLDRSKWRKDAWDRDLGRCLECGVELRQPCIAPGSGYTRSPHEGRTTAPAPALLNTNTRKKAFARQCPVMSAECAIRRIDLDDLERKARAAEQSAWTTDEVAVAIVKAEGGEQIADAYDNTPWPDRRCVANAQHIAAASPPVVLALIARNRELEAGMSALLGSASPHPVGHPSMSAAWKAGEALLVKGAVLPARP